MISTVVWYWVCLGMSSDLRRYLKMAHRVKSRTKPPTTRPAMKKSCHRWNSVRPCVVDPEYWPNVGSLQPARTSAPPTTAAAASSRERRRGRSNWGVDSGASAEGLVNDESTTLTLSNPAEKDEVAAQRVAPRVDCAQWACAAAVPSPSPPDSLAAQAKIPRAMVEVDRAARAAKTS